MQFVDSASVRAMAAASNRTVELENGPVPLGHYPLVHIAALAVEYAGELSEIVERIESDGWTPGEVMANAYPNGDAA